MDDVFNIKLAKRSHWDDYGVYHPSRNKVYRYMILKLLASRPDMNFTEISMYCGIERKVLSPILKWFYTYNMIESKTDNKTGNKLYSLTHRGHNLIKIYENRFNARNWVKSDWLGKVEPKKVNQIGY